ncbi:zinc FYVE domain containing protein [Ceratocystis lukuohia]|uniref:Zinc FYVE domain containing protein n=1 Tax=Ceratocystis lukuohia TaxID=2019550 RepID=A0ABR4MT70_9PEZI
MADRNDIDELLNRLKALKPGTAAAKDAKPAKSSLSAFAPQKSQTSREDSLAARLKTLRNSAAVNVPSSDASPSVQKHTGHSTPQKSTSKSSNPGLIEGEREEATQVLSRIDGPTPHHSEKERIKREIEEALENELPNLDTPCMNSRNGDNLGLPSVPSELPVASSPLRPTTDVDSVAARLLALQTPSSPPKAASAETDALGLPSVPTSISTKFKRLATKTDYTDEDADTWCIVCLSDATLQCLGCEGEGLQIYCAECWSEMHLGPMASYDDSTHEAIRFVKPRKENKKKVAIGAS